MNSDIGRLIYFVDELKPQLLEMGICEVLIPLTNSPSVEVQGNSAAALGNLSSKGMFTKTFPLVHMIDHYVFRGAFVSGRLQRIQRRLGEA